MFLKLDFVALRRILALTTVSLFPLSNTARAAFLTFEVGGTAAPNSIQNTVDAFRAAIGGPNNANNPGPLGGGRREINWDGGGAATATASGPTLSAFTNIRGSTFTTPGTGFLQTPRNDPALTDINKTYSTTFSAFSPQRIFTSLGSNITDVTFSVPGSNGATPATVGAFGAVFSDVDLPNVSRLEFFNSSDLEILSLNVLPGMTSDGSLSFLGAVAEDGERIARVRITAGDTPLGPNDSSRTDVVALDDFIYSEPRSDTAPLPEPTSLVLTEMAAISIAGFLLLRRRTC